MERKKGRVDWRAKENDRTSEILRNFSKIHIHAKKLGAEHKPPQFKSIPRANPCSTTTKHTLANEKLS